ncbi:hypothetical protein IFM89_027307 [Coptis chinensis]|uniref:3-beta hydroxysteroid dehydrogenase/isomerase domain-containing protein n=1 Tax=Coptis chinensis TaxID=261450 RepID=A0A835I6S0_9MAGN|nr:hypothetical protein IFM89_027307 [Coptis chinensis]
MVRPSKNIGRVRFIQGKEMMQTGRIDNVNINGTCHVLDACLEFGIKRLYDHVDPYGWSKSIAEQLVLKSKAVALPRGKNGTCLYTCAIRPAAIYGPGEERHFPRIVSLAKLVCTRSE